MFDMNEVIEIDEDISKKVIEVRPDANIALPTPSLQGDLQKKTNLTFANSFDVINEWERIHSKKIKGRLRAIGEYVANENLSRKLPTNKDIRVHLGISKEYCKKILTKARQLGLLAKHEKRSGHQYRYFVTNIQNYLICEKNEAKSEESEEEVNIEKDLLLPLSLLDDLIEHENLSFHHINLKSELKDSSDYDRLNWEVRSNKNRGKVFELKLSQYRRCELIVYPKGTVNMIIKCSNDPIYLTTLHDITNFFSICGEILGVLKAETSNSEPLTDEVPNWKITQIDAAFDIPLAVQDLNQANFSKKKGWLSCSNFGTFRLKYFGQFYQMYSKNILHKGKVLRIEKRFSFLEIQPTAPMIKDRIRRRKG
jgi:hypothetical protein